mmetsp:Transcript_43825/g.95420  ORF Transcript_43825/g.95420 Transcript_43825/m.95420 type:complete len:180 (+) Transcript_43825:77-616(+)
MAQKDPKKGQGVIGLQCSSPCLSTLCHYLAIIRPLPLSFKGVRMCLVCTALDPVASLHLGSHQVVAEHLVLIGRDRAQHFMGPLRHLDYTFAVMGWRDSVPHLLRSIGTLQDYERAWMFHVQYLTPHLGAVSVKAAQVLRQEMIVEESCIAVLMNLEEYLCKFLEAQATLLVLAPCELQ